MAEASRPHKAAGVDPPCPPAYLWRGRAATPSDRNGPAGRGAIRLRPLLPGAPPETDAPDVRPPRRRHLRHLE